MFPLKGEPVAIIGIVVAVLTAVQQATLPLSQTVHTIIAIVLVGLGAVVARSQVAPVLVKKSAASRRR